MTTTRFFLCFRFNGALVDATVFDGLAEATANGNPAAEAAFCHMRV